MTKKIEIILRNDSSYIYCRDSLAQDDVKRAIIELRRFAALTERPTLVKFTAGASFACMAALILLGIIFAISQIGLLLVVIILTIFGGFLRAVVGT